MMDTKRESYLYFSGSAGLIKVGGEESAQWRSMGDSRLLQDYSPLLDVMTHTFHPIQGDVEAGGLYLSF